MWDCMIEYKGTVKCPASRASLSNKHVNSSERHQIESRILMLHQIRQRCCKWNSQFQPGSLSSLSISPYGMAATVIQTDTSAWRICQSASSRSQVKLFNWQTFNLAKYVQQYGQGIRTGKLLAHFLNVHIFTVYSHYIHTVYSGHCQVHGESASRPVNIRSPFNSVRSEDVLVKIQKHLQTSIIIGVHLTLLICSL